MEQLNTLNNAVTKASTEAERLANKTPYWTARVTEAEKNLAEAIAGRDANAAKLADATAALADATTKRDALAAKVDAFKKEIAPKLASIDDKFNRIAADLS
jgi:chromosome segregation ATPase